MDLFALLLVPYAVFAIASAATGTRAPRTSVALALVPHLIALGVVVRLAPQVLDGDRVAASIQWVDLLDLSLGLQVDALALVMVGLIAGIGILVVLFGAGYTGWSSKMGPLLGGLVAFAGAMQLLVVADDILTLYVGWELTSIASFGLIGQSHHSQAARDAARPALITTAAGGLAMLAGLVALGQATGEWTLTGLAEAAPGPGGVVELAVVLVVLGAATKSAQVPFATWLPGAMAAPTPVSAYLHSATMVKAGVYLLLRMSPVLEGTDTWTPLVVAFGSVTLLTAGWRALQVDDAKQLLAWSTVSQLGLLVTAIGIGGEEALLGALALVLAHAVAKAGLFMTVGAVDVATGTRQLPEMAGVWRRFPVLGVAVVLCGASLAGIPLLAGFVAKEEVLAGLLHQDALGTWMAVAVAVGSGFTVAYTLRLVRAGLGSSAPAADHGVDRPAVAGWRLALLSWPAAALGAISLVVGWFPGVQDRPVGAALGVIAEVSETPHLYLWHGFTVALGLSALAIGGGLAVERWLGVRHAPRLWPPAPAGTFTRGHDLLTSSARRLSSVTQSGSLPVYLTTLFTVLVVVPGIPLVAAAVEEGAVRGSPLSIGDTMLVLAIAGAAIVTERTDQRFAAVLSLGAVGFGVALVFVRWGAPDLALTQLIVETLSLLLFVLALRDLPQRFGPQPAAISRSVRWIVATCVGAMVTTFTLVAGAARTATPPAAELMAIAEPDGGGKNVVNVILTDIRGLDTLGEITVLVVAAVGVALLVGLSAWREGQDLTADELEDRATPEETPGGGAEPMGASTVEGEVGR